MPIAPVVMTPEQASAYRKQKRKEAHSKRIQGTLGVAAAAAGATGAGLVTAGKIKKLPHLVERGYTVGTGSAGLGALAGFNAARGQFKDASTAQKESRMKMDNTYPLRKSLVEIVKAAERKPAKKKPSVAVPKDNPAWRMAGSKNDLRWRNYVSPGARTVYDYPLASSRQKRDKWGRIGNASYAGGGGALVSAALLRKAPKKVRIPLAGLGVAGIAGGVESHRRSDRYDLASRKIRARGMLRMLDAQRGANAVVPVEKALLPRIPGSYNRSALVRLRTGKTILRRPSPTGGY